MKFLEGFQGVCKNIVLFKEELTDIEVDLYSNNKVDLPSVPERYNVPYSEVLTDSMSTYNEELPYGYPYGGLLFDQKNVVQGTLYKGKVNEKMVLCLAKANASWTVGTEIPSDNFDIINMEEIINKV